MSSYDFDSITMESMRSKKGVKWSLFGEDVIPLWLAEPDFNIAPLIKETLIKAVEDEDLLYSNDDEFRRAAAEKVRRVNKIEAEEEDIYVTQGVLPSMWLSIKAVCREGDQVVVTDPMYWPFYNAVEVTKTEPLYWRLDEEDDYRFNIDALNEMITPKTRLIFVCNPHNPTGRVMTKEELRGISDIAVDRNLYVMSDELWEDIRFDGRSHVSIASLNPEISERTISSFGFSKTFGVAGLQIGYMVVTNKNLMEKIRKIAKGVLRGASSLSRAAGVVMLSGALDEYVKSMLRYLESLRSIAEKRFKEMTDVTCPKLEGTYLMFPNLSSYGMVSEAMAEYLLKEGKVAVTPGSEFGHQGEGHIRICIATSKAILTEALDRIQNALAKLRTYAEKL